MFMVVFYGRDNRIGKSYFAKDRSTDIGMNLGLFQFSRRKSPRLIQNMFRDRELPDVMKQGTGPQRIKFIVVKADRGADSHCVDLGAANVPDADLVAGVYGGRKGLNGRQV
jgi:hypothetical protein